MQLDHGWFVRFRTFQEAMYRAVSDDRFDDYYRLRAIIDRMKDQYYGF